ncbi:MAG: DnaA N-terminal domain-containing protein, partial [Parasphingorhabdus sp.]|uniref:DnaA N-terminal domain-containing protein n=1 Tax=Parasphingorhabdus sp. TaxID=2709688 RepID=UPI003297FFA5
MNESVSDRIDGLPENESAISENIVSADLETIWQKICAGLRRDLGAQIFGQWIKPVQLTTFDPDSGILQLTLPSEFAANWVRDRYSERLLLAWKAHHPAIKGLSFQAQ